MKRKLKSIMTEIYSIEGNIGSGKSTLVRILQKYFNNDNVVFMEEPVSLWMDIKDDSGENMIEKFYKDQEKYAFSFQMMAYISRLSLMKKCVRENPDSIIICERSLQTDKNVFAKMLYDEGKIEDVKYQVYLKWFNEFIEDIPLKGIIYVKAMPEVSHSRVKLRAREGEDIPIDYLRNCHLYHEKWLENKSENLLILNGNEEKKTSNDYEAWIDSIKKFIKYNVNKY